MGSISVIPEGSSLGRTTLAGIVSYEKLKIVAAGGGVATHEGCAEGYGSDKFKVDFLHHHFGGLSWEGARSQAESAVARYLPEVRKRAAEIIASLGKVAGSLLHDILARAEFELHLERTLSGDALLAAYGTQPIFEKPIEVLRTYTEIETLITGEQQIRYVVDGEEKKKERVCPKCEGMNGHFAQCSKVAQRKETSILIWQTR